MTTTSTPRTARRMAIVILLLLLIGGGFPSHGAATVGPYAGVCRVVLTATLDGNTPEHLLAPTTLDLSTDWSECVITDGDRDHGLIGTVSLSGTVHGFSCTGGVAHRSSDQVFTVDWHEGPHVFEGIDIQVANTGSVVDLSLLYSAERRMVANGHFTQNPTGAELCVSMVHDADPMTTATWSGVLVLGTPDNL